MILDNIQSIASLKSKECVAFQSNRGQQMLQIN